MSESGYTAILPDLRLAHAPCGKWCDTCNWLATIDSMENRLSDAHDALYVLNGTIAKQRNENKTLQSRIAFLDAENARLREQAEALKAAILDIDAHSTAMGEDGDGFITGGYIVTVGSLHRALGAVGHTARKCSHEARCPTCAQAEALAEALDFVLSFVPPCAEDVPEGLGAMFYGTLTREGDLKVKARVDDARAALRAYRRGDCPGCSFQRQTGGNHDDVPTGDADPNCPYREGS